MSSTPESKDAEAGLEKESAQNLSSRLAVWLRKNALDFGVVTSLVAGAIFIIFLRWDVDEVKEDVEGIKERVIRTEAMTEGIRGDIRDVHRDAAYIAGRLDEPEAMSHILPDREPGPKVGSKYRPRRPK